MYKVILIDDEPLARTLMATLLKAHPSFEVVAECGDGFEGFKAIQQQQPDLVFLDVQMPRLSGFEMLELLDEPPSVIFTTAFDSYAMKAFEAHAVDYLLKPITRARFDKAIEKWMQQSLTTSRHISVNPTEVALPDAYQERIVVKDRGSIRIIPATDILYLEANDDYVKIVVDSGSFLKKITLGQLEQSLNPAQFVRVHRSYVIPVTQLQKIEPYEKDGHIARLHCGAKVLVSKNGLAKLKSVLGW